MKLTLGLKELYPFSVGMIAVLIVATSPSQSVLASTPIAEGKAIVKAAQGRDRHHERSPPPLHSSLHHTSLSLAPLEKGGG